MPLRLARRFGRAAGLLLYKIWASRRRIAVANIREAIGRGALETGSAAEKIAEDCFKNLGESFIEIIKIYSGLDRKIMGGITFRGLENFEAPRSARRGIIFVTAHAGNWELLALASSVKFGKIDVIARPLKNPYLNGLLERIRGHYGNEVVYKQGALRRMLKTLKSGGMTGILMDQAVLRDEGHIVEFLGRGAWTTKMPAVMGKRTRAALLPIFIKRKNGGHEIDIYPEVPVEGTEEEVLLRLNRKIGEHIRENPEEWLWIHRRWKRVPGAGAAAATPPAPLLS